jgi:hypothetical protein
MMISEYFTINKHCLICLQYSIRIRSLSKELINRFKSGLKYQENYVIVK